MHAPALTLFLPCPAGVEGFLAQEVAALVPAQQAASLSTRHGGVSLQADWATLMRLNLHCRLAQRVLIQLAERPYYNENHLYEAALDAPWEQWLSATRSFKIDWSARQSPLHSLNFAALKVKDGLVDRLRAKTGARPDVERLHPDVRVFAHFGPQLLSLYLDSSGEPLFKRGWRQDKGDAPLKETLAAALLVACDWNPQTPLYDPCCGSGTIVIEAAQRAAGIAPGLLRHFGFEKLLPFAPHPWGQLKAEAQAHAQAQAQAQQGTAEPLIFGSDVAHRMVDFAQRNAERAGVAGLISLRGGDALQRLPPCAAPATLLLNPPYGERIDPAGSLGQQAKPSRARRESAQTYQLPRATDGSSLGDLGDLGNFAGVGRVAGPGERSSRASIGRTGMGSSMGAARDGRGGDGDGSAVGTGGGAHTSAPDPADDFFRALAAHWKRHYGGWSAWILTPDFDSLSARMRLKATRRVPLWNGPIECRLMRFDLTASTPVAAKQHSGGG